MAGIGNDIIEVERIANAIKKHGNHFLNRIFTEQEQTYCKQFQHAERHFAGRFAAKEAVAKALGTGIGASFGWKDIDIVKDSHGKPHVQLSKQVRDRFDSPTIHLSISHCKCYATAVAFVT